MADEFELEENLEGTFEVKTPSGDSISVLNEEEQSFYTSLVRKYRRDFKFTNVSDLQTLTIVVALETAQHRWTQWLLSGKDYWGDFIVPDRIKKDIKDTSVELRLLKDSLGIDRKTREKDSGDNFADRMNRLYIRAKRFGYMRNEQAVKAITLWQELVGEVTFYRQADAEEREEMHKNPEDILNWIISKIPEFEEIDQKFRDTDQKYWIRAPLDEATGGDDL